MARGLIIPDPAEETDGLLFVSFCIPNSRSWRGIITGWVRELSYGRRWNDRTGDVKGVQDVAREIYATMSMCDLDAIKLSIDNISTTLANLGATTSPGCGCGANGAGGQEAGPNPNTTTDPTEGSGTPPPGFASWQAYVDYKCQIAQLIVDDLLDDIQWLKTKNLVALTLSALFIGFLTPIAGDELIALLALVLVMSDQGQPLLDDLEDTVSNHVDDLKCSLFVTTNAQQAKDNFLAELETHANTEADSSLFELLINQYFALVVSYDAVNRMFYNEENVTHRLPTADCSTCEQPIWWDCVTGDVVASTPTTVDVDAILAGDGNYVASIGKTPRPDSISWSLVSGSLTDPTVWEHMQRHINQLFCGAGDGAGWTQEISNHINNSPYTATMTFQIRSATAFRVQFSFVD